MDKKAFTVEISTDNPNNISAKEIHLALMKYFVAHVYIDVQENAQQSDYTFAPLCDRCGQVASSHPRPGCPVFKNER